jgi:hypothetical protein
MDFFLFPLTQFLLQLLERALEAAGNDLDSAIKSLTDLHLEPEEINLASVVGAFKDGIPVNTYPATEGICISILQIEEPSGIPCPNVLPCSTNQPFPPILSGRSFWKRP